MSFVTILIGYFILCIFLFSRKLRFVRLYSREPKNTFWIIEKGVWKNAVFNVFWLVAFLFPTILVFTGRV